MQVVINIDDGLYEWVHRQLDVDEGWSMVQDAIMSGTPLPKGHGRLIDADKFLKDNEAYTGFILDSRFFGGKNAYKDTLEDLVNEADAIIEADREV
jgi:hypothetical protein